MPCVECNAEFTVFSSKYRCSICKKYFCQSCLQDIYNLNVASSTSSLPFAKRLYKQIPVCELCFLLTHRPLCYSDLLKIKIKHLNYYLRRRQISTTGCVEKDDLIKLILRDAQQSPQQPPLTPPRASSPDHQQQPSGTRNCNAESGSSGTSGIKSSHFCVRKGSSIFHKTQYSATKSVGNLANLRRTCQKFFSNLSDNLTVGATATTTTSKVSVEETRRMPDQNVPDQPGLVREVRVRQMPSYSANGVSTSHHIVEKHYHYSTNEDPGEHQSSEEEEQLQRSLYVDLPPESSTKLAQSRSIATDEPSRPDFTQPSTSSLTPDSSDACECLNNDLYEKFQQYRRQQKRTDNCSEQNESASHLVRDRNSVMLDSGTNSLSCHSSFEELGAVGGIEESNQNNRSRDVWQLVNYPDELNERSSSGKGDMKEEVDYVTTTEQNVIDNVPNQGEAVDSVDSYYPGSTKKINNLYSDLKMETAHQYSSYLSVLSSNCKHCGKYRAPGVYQQLENLREHLLKSQMDEADIEIELKAFFDYMEDMNESTAQDVTLEDVSDHEDEPSGGYHSTNVTRNDDNLEILPNINQENRPTEATDNQEEKDTKTKAGEDQNVSNKKLDEYKSMGELESLTVKELKTILVINRIDYKGCCEKHELLDRVKRLWTDLKSTPCIDKLAVNELCKICMDAPLECVVLECGHMATCTKCAKVLTECPICRQYIVRIVRFFRA